MTSSAAPPDASNVRALWSSTTTSQGESVSTHTVASVSET